MCTETGSDGTVQSGFPLSPGDRDHVCPGARNAACVIFTGVYLCTSGVVAPHTQDSAQRTTGLWKRHLIIPKVFIPLAPSALIFQFLLIPWKVLWYLKHFQYPWNKVSIFWSNPSAARTRLVPVGGGFVLWALASGRQYLNLLINWSSVPESYFREKWGRVTVHLPSAFHSPPLQPFAPVLGTYKAPTFHSPVPY